VPNPLYQYTFNPIDPSFPSPWNSYRTTIRDPTRNAPNVTNVKQLTMYDVSLTDTSFSHSLFLPVIWGPYREILPQVSTTFFRVLLLGLLLATTQWAMVAALVTLWRPYMTEFMAPWVVTWVIPSLLVTRGFEEFLDNI